MQTVVIVGGGAGGLELATRLGHKLGRRGHARVILVDKNISHIWKPLLHEVASGSLDPSTDAVMYGAHAANHYYEFQHGEIIAVDTRKKQITLAELLDEAGEPLIAERQLNYDTLVLAVGSVSNDFGTPGVAEHCYFLDSATQAERFHHALINNFVKVNRLSERGLDIAIVGGGATGVELSAELYHVATLAQRYGMSQMSSQRLKIRLIEAGPSILPALPARIATAVKKELTGLGVDILEDTRVARAEKGGFITSEGQRIDADMMVWAAGVKAPDFFQQLQAFELNRLQQIVVEPTLQAKNHEDVFVLGDCCGCQQADGSWVPPRAQSAHQMAALIANNILHQYQGQPLVAFHYRDYGSLVNLSRYSTVGSLMGNLSRNSLFIEGRVARFVYISLYRMHQIAIHGWVKGMLMVLVEKLNQAVRPKLKLH